MCGIEKIKIILEYRKRPDLAKAIKGCSYTLNESTTYGSHLHSTLTSVELYAPIQQHEFLQILTVDDKEEIIRAFRVLYPVRDNDIEINSIKFLIDPDSPIPQAPRNTPYLAKIDYDYINEQISKCDSKIEDCDFEGAITNARNLIETICKYILDNSEKEYKAKAELQVLYKEAAKRLNLYPVQNVNDAFKKILSGCFNIVEGLATVRNTISDAHGKSLKKYYKPNKRHAKFTVETAKALADFMVASFMERSEYRK